MAVLLNMRPDSEVEPNLAAHLNQLRMENQRPRSIRERRLTVLRAARRLGHPLAEIDRPGLRAWQDSVSYLTPAAMHNTVVHISRYLRWLVAEQIRADDPTSVLIRPRHLHKRLPRPTSEADVLRALAGAEEPVRTWIQLGAFCGLRCCEIADVLRDSIVLGPPSFLRVIGKGGRERMVPLPVSVLHALQTGPFNSRGYLFSRMDGRPGPPSAARVSDRINGHLHEVGVVGSAHGLRHRFGTKLYEATGDPYLVADVMGHQSIETTRDYVRIVSARACAPVEAISHPAA